MSSGMKGMMGGSSLANVSRYARWFLDGSCGNSHTGLRSSITVLNGSITVTHRLRVMLLIPHSSRVTSWQSSNLNFLKDGDTERDWVHKLTYHRVFKFTVKFLEFAGKFLWTQIKREVNLQLRSFWTDTDCEQITHLPGLTQPAYCWITQSHNDSKEGVHIPVLLTAFTENMKRQVRVVNAQNCT